jgi:hypothetical protein
MRFFALLALSSSLLVAQTKAPITVQTYPAVPILQQPVADVGASMRLSEAMPFVAPIVFETPEITSSLILANVTSEKQTVTITLFSLDGKTSNIQHVGFEPHEKKEFPLVSPPSNSDIRGRWGSVVVEQDPTTKMAVVIVGQVVVTDQRSSAAAYIDEELAMPEMDGSTRLSAVTDESAGAPMVAVTNISSSQQNVVITCVQSDKTFPAAHAAIAGHATALFKGCSNTSISTLGDYIESVDQSNAQGVYSINLEGDGNPGSLVAFALAPHYRGKDLVFSAVPFSDPETVHSSDVVFAGVPIGAQETLPSGVYIPRLTLANFSSSPLHYSVSLADTLVSPVRDTDGNNHPPQLSIVHTGLVPPHQTEEYVFSGQEAQNGLLHSVVVTTDSKPGDYQAKLVSRSTGRLYQVEYLAKETLDMNNTGVHPWTLAGDTQSHIILFNHTKKDRKVGIFISAGATLWSSEIILAASETREISINKLQREQIKDDTGARLPLAVKEGVVNWMTPDSGDVTGRLMVTSRENAMARNFSCGSYTGACQLVVQTVGPSVPAGGAEHLYSALANFCSFPTVSNQNHARCTYGNTTPGVAYFTWTAAPTNIITLNSLGDGSVPEPMFKGISPGSGTATVEAWGGGCQIYATNPAKVTPPPDHVSVHSDQEGYPSQCPTTGVMIRQMQLQIVDSSNAPVVTTAPLVEQYQNLSQNSCGNGQPVPVACAAADPGGTFVDTLAVGVGPKANGYCSVGIPPQSGCGYSQTSVWSMCGGGFSNTIWNSPRVTLSNSITVNGSSATFPTNTQFH